MGKSRGFVLPSELMIQTHWTFPPFVRLVDGPVVTASKAGTFKCPMAGKSVAWRCGSAFNPAAAVLDGKVYLVFRAEDGTGQGLGRYTSRLGLAESDDGVSFTVLPKPVLHPAKDAAAGHEWPGGCEDPRIVAAADGRFVLTYTAWDGKVARLSVATSTDLMHWKKHGPAFAKAGGGQWLDLWSKAGSIVCELKDDNLLAVKIKGKYWMYWGEGTIYVASSPNLLDWTPACDEAGRLIPVLNPRMCMFDSEMVEPGPPALLTPQGIVLLFNAKNDGTTGDPALRGGAYTAAQALFDADDPGKFLDRTNWPFLKPETPYEETGQYEPGKVFVEGLVPFKEKWLLYYGCADSAIGVAEAPRKP
jgi:beta-1,2-mannosidase